MSEFLLGVVTPIIIGMIVRWIKDSNVKSIKNRSVVDLDNPENNCTYCGVDHHYNERNAIK
jgi:hypothetical protein